MKKEAMIDNQIDFSQISSDTNGKGVYLLESTKEDEHPIYYYRGEVNNNNVKFGNFCWKIVRTTSTGGTKLIYNGKPTNNGDCTNRTGWNTYINQKEGQNPIFQYNEFDGSPASAGYMYGEIYYTKTDNPENIGTIKYGNSFTYDEGTREYTLVDTIDVKNNPDTKINNNHYTCWNTSGKCTTIRYIRFTRETFSNNSSVAYINIENGKSVEDAFAEMYENINDSSIKKEIDKWYEENMTEYTKYLEDTIWCNDRSMNEEGTDESWINNGWKPNGGNTNNYLIYGAAGRMLKTYKPSVSCKNKNDTFTVSNESGNKALTYPAGLLTADEVNMAGGAASDNTTYYLYSGLPWWTMSPSNLQYINTFVFGVSMNGQLSNTFYLGSTQGYVIRPSISLASNIKMSDGDGTPENPYTAQLN